MRNGLLLIFFIISTLTFAQVGEIVIQDSLTKGAQKYEQPKDSLLGILPDKKVIKDSLSQKTKSSVQKEKNEL
ncbi:MAG: hypothetical protein ACPG6F_04130 [Flavobacteriaceae bacterium]